MKCLFQAATVAEGAEIQLLKGMLEQSSIPCMIRNENLCVAMGDIPWNECSPELWVLNETDYPKAEEIVSAWLNASNKPDRPWVCPNCHESIEGQFTSCWKCGQNRA